MLTFFIFFVERNLLCESLLAKHLFALPNMANVVMPIKDKEGRPIFYLLIFTWKYFDEDCHNNFFFKGLRYCIVALEFSKVMKARLGLDRSSELHGTLYVLPLSSTLPGLSISCMRALSTEHSAGRGQHQDAINLVSGYSNISGRVQTTYKWSEEGSVIDWTRFIAGWPTQRGRAENGPGLTSLYYPRETHVVVLTATNRI